MKFQLSLLLLAIVFFWNIFYSTNNCYGQNVSTELSRVREYRMSGLKDEALQLLNSEINTNLNRSELLIQKARESYNKEQYNLSFLLFEKILLLYPNSNLIRFEYAGLLFNRKKWDAAETIFLEYIEYGGTDASAFMMLGYLNLWQQKYDQAEKYFQKAVTIDPGNQAAQNGLDEIEKIKSLYTIGEYHYKSDDQPLYVHQADLQLKQYINPFLSPRMELNYYNFNNSEQRRNVYWLQLGNRFHWRAAKLFLDIQTGRFKKLKTSEEDWTARILLDKNWADLFHSGMEYNNSPYLLTTSSIEQPVKLEQFKLYINRPVSKNWSGELAAVFKNFQDGNHGADYYAWFMGTPFSTDYLNMKIGYGFNYSDTDSSRYVARQNIEEIISTGSYDDIKGIYTPYFTPNDQVIHSLIFNLNLLPASWLEISLGGNIGIYAQSQVPYLYLVENGAFDIQRSFITVKENVWEAHADLRFNVLESAALNIGIRYYNLFFYEQIDLSTGFTLRF